MLQKLSKLLTIYDKLLIIFILLITVIGIGWSVFGLASGEQGAKYVVIEHQGRLINKFRLTPELDKKIAIELDRGRAEVRVRKGEIKMLEMPEDICPLGICSDTGWISNAGETIVCIPNQIIVAVEAQDSTDKIDAISY